tara:strand:+ start:212 stop:946 length:735 start_codon:yes stop_codon:yes gene_type:complete
MAIDPQTLALLRKHQMTQAGGAGGAVPEAAVLAAMLKGIGGDEEIKQALRRKLIEMGQPGQTQVTATGIEPPPQVQQPSSLPNTPPGMAQWLKQGGGGASAAPIAGGLGGGAGVTQTAYPAIAMGGAGAGASGVPASIGAAAPATAGASGGAAAGGGASALGAAGPVGAIAALVMLSKGAEARNPNNALGKILRTVNPPDLTQMQADPGGTIPGVLTGLFPFLNHSMNQEAKEARPWWEDAMGF